MKLKKNSLLNSLLFEKFNTKILLKGKKEKYLKFIFKTWSNLKKSKIFPKLCFFLILEKIKPIFFYSRIQKKKKKKKIITYKPYVLNLKQRYFISLKWLLLYLKKKMYQKFILKLEYCFKIFLDYKRKNLALLQKKKTYSIILKYKHFIKL